MVTAELLQISSTVDSRLSMANHVSGVCRACYFQLRQLRVLLQSLTSEAATSLVHAFISCRLDYCALLYGIADCHLQWLQSVQNAAARLVTGLRRRSTSRRSWSLCTGYRFGNGWLASWQLWCTNALMVALRGTWRSSVIQASTDVQEWDQPTVGSSTYHVRRLHLVTGRSPSLVHTLGTTYLMPSETRLCHSQHLQNCWNHTCLFDYHGACDITGAYQMY